MRGIHLWDTVFVRFKTCSEGVQQNALLGRVDDLYRLSQFASTHQRWFGWFPFQNHPN